MFSNSVLGSRAIHNKTSLHMERTYLIFKYSSQENWGPRHSWAGTDETWAPSPGLRTALLIMAARSLAVSGRPLQGVISTDKVIRRRIDGTSGRALSLDRGQKKRQRRYLGLVYTPNAVGNGDVRSTDEIHHDFAFALTAPLNKPCRVLKSPGCRLSDGAETAFTKNSYCNCNM